MPSLLYCFVYCTRPRVLCTLGSPAVNTIWHGECVVASTCLRDVLILQFNPTSQHVTEMDKELSLVRTYCHVRIPHKDFLPLTYLYLRTVYMSTSIVLYCLVCYVAIFFIDYVAFVWNFIASMYRRTTVVFLL